MKTLYKLMLAVCLFSAVDANAELKAFKFNLGVIAPQETNKAILEIKQGEVITVKSYFINGWVGIALDYGDDIIVPSGIVTNSYHSHREEKFPTIVGPVKIIFSEFNSYADRGINGRSAVLIYDLQKISTSSSGGSTSNLPSNTVVIPTDASGPVEIIMESSKDLVNWTRAEPGTYGADTPKRFFRVRAVVKN